MLLTIAVMILLFSALILLAFVLGNQYAVSQFKNHLTPASTPPQATSTLPETEEAEIAPDVVPTFETITKKFTAARNSETTLSRGEAIVIDDTIILFSDIMDDSRCPEGVNCNVAGEAIVELLVNDVSGISRVYLSSLTGGRPNRPSESFINEYGADLEKTNYQEEVNFRDGAAIISGHTVRFSAIFPGGFGADKPRDIKKEDYKITLEIK